MSESGTATADSLWISSVVVPPTAKSVVPQRRQIAAPCSASGGAAPNSLVRLAERFGRRSPFEPDEIARLATLVADVLVAGLRL